MTNDFGLCSLWLQERKVHTIGKLEKSQVQSAMKYFTHTTVADISIVLQVYSSDQCSSVPRDLLHSERLKVSDPVQTHMPTKRDSGKKCLRLRWKKINNLLCSTVDSEDIFSALFGHQNGEDTFWLDSSSIDQVLCQLPLD
jgi:para-aminobenzoate synthetase